MNRHNPPQQPIDPVEEYLNRLRSLGPSEKLSHDIDLVEREHRAERARAKKKFPMGFRKPDDN